MKSAFEPAFEGRKTVVATAAIGLFFMVLVVRLYFLQVVKGDEYVLKSASNFVQERRIPHARGTIYDQAGHVLADNRPSHDVYLTVAFLPDSQRSLRRALEPLELARTDIAELDARLLSAVLDVHDVVVAKDGVGAAQCTALEGIAQKHELRGVDIERARDDGSCRVLLHGREFPSRASVFKRVQDLTGIPAQEMKDRAAAALLRSQGLGKFKPTLLLEDVGFEVYARLSAAASLGDIPGISVVDTHKRRYRNNNTAAHVLGYLNEVSQTELDSKKDQGYYLGDLIGRRGIEATHEDELRGKDGVQRVVVDAKGRDMGARIAEELLGDGRIEPPTPGTSLALSLDAEMQHTAENSFGGVAGSVVAMEVNTGFILAMASFPNYDPNLVSGPWSKDEKRRLDKDPQKPWTNKAIQEHYAPGSTFKAITASAGLRNKLIDERTLRACPGFFRLGRSMWRCFNRGGHGQIALVRALQYSCDTYFYGLGYELGPDRLAETARIFGFGSRTGLDLDRETPGIMPDRDYYVRRFGAYTPGLVVNNSIGQGDVTVTPLQLAVAYAAIGNGGTIYKPQIVRELKDADGHIEQIHDPVVVAQLGLDEKNLAIMKEALSHVTDPGGTAAGLMWRKDEHAAMSEWLRTGGVKMVGKTGTAQVVKLSKSVQHVDAKDVPYEQRDHAWFVAFAPYDKPEIVVVTMTEHGGFGGSTSGPVTGEVMKTWFTKVRGHGRYANYPPIEPAKHPIVFVPKKIEPTEETAPDLTHEPTEGDAPPDATAKPTPFAPPKSTALKPRAPAATTATKPAATAPAKPKGN